MVVTGSRKEAVRWRLAIRRDITTRGSCSEARLALDPSLNRQDLRNDFKGDHHLLLLANKFQTDIDEPLLSVMYVDKCLGGIQAAQTLPRLNRCHTGKDTTCVVDSVNDSRDILASFNRYHQAAELADGPTRTGCSLCAPSSMDRGSTTPSMSSAWCKSCSRGRRSGSRRWPPR
jgi:type I restriction enzyme R subunit